MKARNVYGDGLYSDSLVTKASKVPDTPSVLKSINPTEATGMNYNKVFISWDKPNAQGSDLTHYLVQIKRLNNSNVDTYYD